PKGRTARSCSGMLECCEAVGVPAEYRGGATVLRLIRLICVQRSRTMRWGGVVPDGDDCGWGAGAARGCGRVSCVVLQELSMSFDAVAARGPGSAGDLWLFGPVMAGRVWGDEFGRRCRRRSHGGGWLSDLVRGRRVTPPSAVVGRLDRWWSSRSWIS